MIGELVHQITTQHGTESITQRRDSTVFKHHFQFSFEESVCVLNYADIYFDDFSTKQNYSLFLDDKLLYAKSDTNNDGQLVAGTPLGAKTTVFSFLRIICSHCDRVARAEASITKPVIEVVQL